MKRLTAVVAATLLCLAMIAPASAAPQQQVQEAPAAPAHPQACDTWFDAHYHVAGNDINPSSGKIRAIKMTIDPKEDSFRVCSHGNVNPGGAAFDAVTAYVMLTQPGTNNWIQIGIIRCNFDGADPSYCDTGGNDDGTQAHYYVQTSGCAGGYATADKGIADFYAHEYKLVRSGNTIKGSIDGEVVYEADWTTHPRLSCWLDGSNDVDGQIDCEVFDGGSLCAHEVDKLNFDTIGGNFIDWEAGGTWSTMTWQDPCDHIQDSSGWDAHCDVIYGLYSYGDDFDVWQNH